MSPAAPRTRNASPSFKFAVPRASPHEIPRGQISDIVFSGGGARLVLVRAPAGYGKTTVMRQIFEGCTAGGVAASWLNVDSSDNDASRFLRALLQALDQLRSGGAEKWSWSTSRAEDLNPATALELIDQIAAGIGTFVLFIDEFEAIQNPAVLAVVRRLLLQLPTGVQFIVGARNVPELGLGGLRARGWLLEIDASQLRFSFEEASEYLKLRGHAALRTEDVDRLHRSTEGWAAALWLASVAIGRSDRANAVIDGFSGSHSAIAEYLADDVIAQQPEDIRRFLLRTSILSMLEASLCDAVCRSSDSAAMMERLHRSNLFLIALDDKKHEYRYHPLFADFLRGQLAAQSPGEVAGLHLAASAWFEERGRPIPAIEHALASGRFERAVELMRQEAPRLLAAGRVRLLGRWISALPPQILEQEDELRCIEVWCVHFTRGPREAMALLQSIEPTKLSEAARAHAYSVKPVLLSMLDRVEEALALGTANFAALDPRFAFERSMLANCNAMCALLTGRDEEIRLHLDQARGAQAGLSGAMSTSFTDTAEGIMKLMRGQLVEGTARFRSAIRPDGGPSVHNTNGNSMAGILLAETLYEIDDRIGAERLLHVCVPLLREVGVPDQLISGHVLLSRLVVLAGDFEQGFQLLADLEALAHRTHLERVIAAARLERSRLALMRGDIVTAREELSRAGDPKLWDRVGSMSFPANDVETHDVGRCRLLLRTGQLDEALSLLSRALGEAERRQHGRRVLKLQILRIQAYWLKEDKRTALQLLPGVLDMASREGFIRTFADEGDTISAAVREFLSTPAAAGRLSDPSRKPWLERLRRALGVDLKGDATPEGSPTPLVEALTRKEIEVTTSLAQGLSNRGLAERFHVSQATIRAHLRNISAKLGATNRMQAVVLARRAGLIP